MPMSMFTEISTEETERSKNEKGFKGPGGEHIKNQGQQVMSVRTLEGFVRKSTWQVADVRRLLVPTHPTSSMVEMTCSSEERGVHHEQEQDGEIGAQTGRQRLRVRLFCESAPIKTGENEGSR